ncbi:MAG: lysophospholipid acyltransferase family protein [Limisphaerales bacterium]
MTEASSPPEKTGPPAKKRKSGVIVPHKAKWHQRLGAFAVFVSLRALMFTVRCRFRERSEFFAPNAPGPAIFCFWHNRLASCIKIYEDHRKSHAPGRGMAALVSASRDGAFLAGILEWFGVQPVRGSTSRRGPQAMLELTTWAARGYDLTITPDGPRGPCYVVQDGAMSLAQVTGLPVVPVAFNVGWKLRVKSWDRFQIPLPFARCEVTVGRIMRVPAEATDAERESLRQQLEAELRAISRD